MLVVFVTVVLCVVPEPEPPPPPRSNAISSKMNTAAPATQTQGLVYQVLDEVTFLAVVVVVVVLLPPPLS